MAPVVLILSHPNDAHADAVQARLGDRDVPVFRVDTSALGADLPVAAHLHTDALTGQLGDCQLADVTCAWHRRPSAFTYPDPDDTAEVRAGIGGVLACLPYLNHPADMAAAALKPYQLRTAARHGLRVPETVLSSSLDDALELQRRHQGRIVVKPLSRRVPGLVTEAGRDGWSRPVHLTQQRIEKTADIRLTVVDHDLFAVRITSPHLDWRTDVLACQYALVEPPDELTAAVLAMMASLRLRFAALDFAVDEAGRWWFLEINPNGQWLWLEEAIGIPISDRLAGALAATQLATAPPS